MGWTREKGKWVGDLYWRVEASSKVSELGVKVQGGKGMQHGETQVDEYDGQQQMIV